MSKEILHFSLVLSRVVEWSQYFYYLFHFFQLFSLILYTCFTYFMHDHLLLTLSYSYLNYNDDHFKLYLVQTCFMYICNLKVSYISSLITKLISINCLFHLHGLFESPSTLNVCFSLYLMQYKTHL